MVAFDDLGLLVVASYLVPHLGDVAAALREEDYVRPLQVAHRLAEHAAREGTRLPRLFLSCGRDDYAVEYSRQYHDFLSGLGIAHDYYETEGIHGYESAWTALDRALGILRKEGLLK